METTSVIGDLNFGCTDSGACNFDATGGKMSLMMEVVITHV